MSDGTDHGIRFGRIAAMLPVKDINRACDFYTKALGFTKVFENGTPAGFMTTSMRSTRYASSMDYASSRAFRTRTTVCGPSCSRIPTATA
ncbi:MAG: VOC family protein [Candidatus Binatus sp.]